MHDIKWIRDNPDAFDAALARRGLEPLSSPLLAIDEKRRAAIMVSEQALARRNSASKEIGDAKKAKDDARASTLMAEVAELKTTLPQLELAAKEADEELIPCDTIEKAAAIYNADPSHRKVLKHIEVKVTVEET